MFRFVCCDIFYDTKGDEKMKKICYALLFIAITTAIFIGCGRIQERESKIQADRFSDKKEYLVMSNLAESDKGVYVIEWKEEYTPILFVDKKTGKKTALCQKINCKHDSEQCLAVEAGIMGCMAYSEGTLYFLVQKEDGRGGKLVLYSMNEDGSEKEQLHIFENTHIFPNQAGLYKGKVILSVQTQKELEDGTGLTTAEPSIILYDLKTKEERTLIDGAENKGKYTVPCGGSGDAIYLIEMPWEDTGEECDYLKYDFQTGDLNEVYKARIADVQIIKNDILYLQPKGKKQLESYNIKTKEKKIVFEWKEDVDTVWVREDHVELQKIRNDGKEKKIYCNWYDLEEQNYLFDQYQDLDKIQVKGKMDNGYWVYKDGEPYFYHIEDKSWQEVDEIK